MSHSIKVTNFRMFMKQNQSLVLFGVATVSFCVGYLTHVRDEYKRRMKEVIPPKEVTTPHFPPSPSAYNPALSETNSLPNPPPSNTNNSPVPTPVPNQTVFTPLGYFAPAQFSPTQYSQTPCPTCSLPVHQHPVCSCASQSSSPLTTVSSSKVQPNPIPPTPVSSPAVPSSKIEPLDTPCPCRPPPPAVCASPDPPAAHLKDPMEDYLLKIAV